MLKITVPLTSLTELFDPAGFSDISHSTWGQDANVLVESKQSVANWLENSLWDGYSPVPELKKLAYVKGVVAGETVLTSSSVAHRWCDLTLTENKEYKKTISELFRDEGLEAVLKIDPRSLLFGFWASDQLDDKIIKARDDKAEIVKMPRSILGEIVALGTERVATGGVKSTWGDQTKKASDKVDGKGSTVGLIPYSGSSFTGGDMKMTIVLDVRSLEQRTDATVAEMVYLMGLLAVVNLLDEGILNLRSNCRVEMDEPEVKVFKSDKYWVGSLERDKITSRLAVVIAELDDANRLGEVREVKVK